MKVSHQYHEIKGSNQRTIPIDIHYIESLMDMPIVIFAHGYKGFKDFGAWSLIGDEMARAGIVFVRFNFSHNGVTLTEPEKFDDLEAFGENNYSKEVNDFSTVIDFIHDLAKNHSTWNNEKICIIGHSRGGGMAILTAAENKNVKALITWAAINNTQKRMPKGKELEEWKEKGVRYVLNGRTKQQMPHYFQFFTDLENNKKRLNIEKKASRLTIPWLIIHGDNDEAVAIEDAYLLHQYNTGSQLEIIKNGNHTFSISHPWKEPKLSNEMQEVFDISIQFIKKI